MKIVLHRAPGGTPDERRRRRESWKPCFMWIPTLVNTPNESSILWLCRMFKKRVATLEGGHDGGWTTQSIYRYPVGESEILYESFF